MPLKVLRSDITQIAADAIVNPANPLPKIGGGTDFSIYEKAGKEQLLAARMDIGEMSPGEVALTPAFNLNAKYIIHAVSPVWQDGKHDELKLLRSCYKKSLELAVEKNCRSIAFPLIGTGNNRFPKEKSLLTATGVMQTFLNDHDLEIILAIFGQRTYECSSQFFEDISVFVDEAYEKKVLRREYALRSSFGTIMPRNVFWDDLDDDEIRRICNHYGKNFKKTLVKYVERSGMRAKEIYEAANISRKVYYGIAMYDERKKNRPSKNTLLALIVALKLSLFEALDLLSRAEYLLSNASEFDLIVGRFIKRGRYNVTEINIALYEKNPNSELLGQK